MAHCNTDVDCGGLYDNCGEGIDFRICDTDITDVSSACGDIRYTKGK